MIQLTESFKIPVLTQAILWDLDGVLIDSLSFDCALCSTLLSQYSGKNVVIPKPIIRRYFAQSHRQFWLSLLDHTQTEIAPLQFENLVSAYDQQRYQHAYTLLPGVLSSVKRAYKSGIKMAVVSNNTELLIRKIISDVGLAEFLSCIVGYDSYNPLHAGYPLQKKPRPDMYIAAMKRLEVPANRAVIVEDSVAGARAGLDAGGYVVGVTTGGATRTQLLQCILGGKAQKINTSEKNGYVVATLS